jgi:hypothetical protein
MTRGRPPTPIERKIRLGNPGGRHLVVTPAPTAYDGTVPDPHARSATQAWHYGTSYGGVRDRG